MAGDCVLAGREPVGRASPSHPARSQEPSQLSFHVEPQLLVSRPQALCKYRRKYVRPGRSQVMGLKRERLDRLLSLGEQSPPR